MKNIKDEKSKSVVKENQKNSLNERKRYYESIGIPVEKLFICHGLPMTN